MTKSRTSKDAAALIQALNRVSTATADARIAMTKLGDGYKDATRAVMALATSLKEAHHQARLVALAQDDQLQMGAIMRGYLAGLIAEAGITVDDNGQMDGVVITVKGERFDKTIASQRCEKGDSLNAVTIKLCEKLVGEGRMFDWPRAVRTRLLATGMFSEADADNLAAFGVTDLPNMLTCPASALIVYSSLSPAPISR